MNPASSTALVLALVLAACTHVPAPVAPLEHPVAPIAQQEFVAALDAQLRALETTGYGGAVIVEQGSDVVFARGYGYANRAAGVRFTPDTVAQIASITKSQTAAAIAVLIAQGKVGLSDPLGKFVPEAPEPGRSRTVAQLLTHSSGLADVCTDDFVPQSERMLIEDCLARPLAFPVGEDNYSNLGYSALGLIIQRVTGDGWERALGKLVWRPLGITGIASQFPQLPAGNLARGYLDGKEQPELSRQLATLKGTDWALRGNGALSASPRTMMRYLDAIVDGRGNFPAAARSMLLQPVAGQAGNVREGFGMVFRYDDAGAMTRMGHSGSDGVFLNYLGWLPRNDVRFYFIGNNGEENAQQALSAVIKAIAKLPPRQ